MLRSAKSNVLVPFCMLFLFSTCTTNTNSSNINTSSTICSWYIDCSTLPSKAAFTNHMSEELKNLLQSDATELNLSQMLPGPLYSPKNGTTQIYSSLQEVVNELCIDLETIFSLIVLDCETAEEYYCFAQWHAEPETYSVAIAIRKGYTIQLFCPFNMYTI